MVNRL